MARWKRGLGWNLRGRKGDVQVSQWLLKLRACGLTRPLNSYSKSGAFCFCVGFSKGGSHIPRIPFPRTYPELIPQHGFGGVQMNRRESLSRGLESVPEKFAHWNCDPTRQGKKNGFQTPVRNPKNLVQFMDSGSTKPGTISCSIVARVLTDSIPSLN
jgi:hypothetical protein